MDGILINIGGENHHLFIGSGQVKVLEEKFNQGHGVLFGHFYNGSHTIEMLQEVIRLGIIGAGGKAGDAFAIAGSALQKPLNHYRYDCLKLLKIAIYGGEEQFEEKKPDGGGETVKNQTLPNG